jgi:hypothetical protein
MRIAGLAIGIGWMAAMGFAADARAQDVEDDGVEVTRGAEDLQDLTGTPVAERTRVDTALVFSDRGLRETRVACQASDADGVPVGRAWTRVPAGGVRVILASDLSNGAAFAGQVSCRIDGRMEGKALLVAASGLAHVGAARAEFTGWHEPRRLHFNLVATR